MPACRPCCVLYPSTSASQLQKELCHTHSTNNTEFSHLNSFKKENDCPQRSSVCRDRTVPKIIPTEISAKRVSGVWDFKDEIRDQRFELEQWQMTRSQMS